MSISKSSSFSNLKALYINCTLKKSDKKSHTEGLIKVSKEIMKAENVTVEYLRLVDYNIAYGLLLDMKKEGAEKERLA